MRYRVDAHPSRLRGVPLAGLARIVTKRFRMKKDISVAFVTPAEIKRLNTVYRGKQEATDVLSFSFLPGARAHTRARTLPERAAPVESAIGGEILLCSEIVRAKARERGRALADELTALLLHATLHILGYDHERKSEAETMEALELELLATAGRRLAKS